GTAPSALSVPLCGNYATLLSCAQRARESRIGHGFRRDQRAGRLQRTERGTERRGHHVRPRIARWSGEPRRAEGRRRPDATRPTEARGPGWRADVGYRRDLRLAAG